MNDEADIGFVHTHAEGVGGDDHRNLSGQEEVLRTPALVVSQAGVIGLRLHAENPEGSVLIQADKDSSSEALLAVMAAAREAKVGVSISAAID